jgi:hypothetical protein
MDPLIILEICGSHKRLAGSSRMGSTWLMLGSVQNDRVAILQPTLHPSELHSVRGTGSHKHVRIY